MNLARVLVPALALAAVPAIAAKPQIQWNEGFDFSQIHSFMWKPSAGTSLSQSDPFLHEHIINAIEFHLSSSGLTETDSNPDVLVTYYGSIHTDVSLQSEAYGYGWGGFGGPGWASYGYGMGSPISTETRVVEHDSGTLVVDIIDAGSNELIWRGTASELSVSDNPERRQKTIDKALERMVKQSQKLREQAAAD